MPRPLRLKCRNEPRDNLLIHNEVKVSDRPGIVIAVSEAGDTNVVYFPEKDVRRLATWLLTWLHTEAGKDA